MNFSKQLKGVNSRTRIVGVLGFPVKHSISPPMQNAAFLSEGLNYIYVAFEVKPENIGQALNSLPLLGIEGVNITIPHKEAAMRHMDMLSEEAVNTKAVNTVKIDSGKLTGFNTDVEGFLSPLLSGKKLRPEGKKAVILGAGGAARAAVYALLSSGAEHVAIANRKAARAEKIYRDMERKFPSAEIKVLPASDEAVACEVSGATLLVNATPLGMGGEMALGKPECIHEGLIVYDMVYNPVITPLLREARKRGAGTIGGLGMLVCQGAASFRIWTSQDAPLEVMKTACEQALHGEEG